MTVNGKCLTAKITECHKTGRECSLSDILEDQADPKYFLSETQVQAILSNSIIPSTRMTESTEMIESAPLSTPCNEEIGNHLSESQKPQNNDTPSQDHETQSTSPL